MAPPLESSSGVVVYNADTQRTHVVKNDKILVISSRTSSYRSTSYIVIISQLLVVRGEEQTVSLRTTNVC